MAQMTWPERIKRYLVCFCGIFCVSMGVALFTKSGTGTSAISVIPYTLSLLLPQLSYGTWVALFNMLLAVFQIVLLRKETNWLDIVQQLFFAAIFGSVVDLSMWILTFLNPSAYWECLLVMAVSAPVLAFGAYLTLISRVGVMAGDGFARALSHASGKSFALVRVLSDTSMMLTAVVMCLIAWGQLLTVREGTVYAALATGAIVGWYSKHLKGFEYAILPNNRKADEEQSEQESVPAKNFVVTVGREYGSGGREISRAIAKWLDVPFFDEEILNRLIRDEGFEDDYVAENDQRLDSATREAFYRMYAGAVPEEDLPPVEQLYHAEERVIRNIAAQGSCVIVGRLANHILRDHPYRLDIFVRASMDDRIAHVVEREGVSAEEARAKIERVDHERAEHCRYFAHYDWGDVTRYDVTVNTSRYGIERTGRILAGMAAAARDAKPAAPTTETA